MPFAHLARRLLARELAVFGVIGMICLAGDIVFFNVFAFVAGMTPIVAKCLAMVITGTMSFFGHRHVTFRHRRSRDSRSEVPLFIAVTLATVLLSLLPLYIARHTVGVTSVFWLNVANLAGIALGTAVRYVAYRGVVWSAPAASASVADDIRRGTAVGATARDDTGADLLLEIEHELVRE